jgi:protein gp37
MAGNSNIEWTDATWNPIAGCDPVPLLGPVELRLRSDGVPMNQWGFPLGPCGYYCDESVGHVDHGSNRIHWAIVGCESGPNRRFMTDEWASNLKEQCHRAEVPFFMKQMEINGNVTADIEKFGTDLLDSPS